MDEELFEQSSAYRNAYLSLFDRLFGSALRAMVEAMEAIAALLQPVVEATMEFCQKIYGAIQTEYRARGAIYGDSHDGMIRWFEELCLVAHLRREAEHIEQRHLMLAEIRAMRL